MNKEVNQLNYLQVKEKFKNKTVAIVGSAPSCQKNHPLYIDSHDIVVRVNNYKLLSGTGQRTDVHYSFYGNSIRKKAHELINDGVYLCMNKCPNGEFIKSEWHIKNNKKYGTNYEYIYRKRKNFWFCDTYIPTIEHFLSSFHALDQHIPTTGIACIMDIINFDCKKIYITGFDFFTSNKHNVNENWRKKNDDDPIGHAPDIERNWIIENKHRLELDKWLTENL